MPSTTREEQIPKWFETSRGRSFLSVIRSIVSFWRGYIDLQSWALAVYAIIIVLDGKLFTSLGLVLVGAIALIVLLYFLDKWLANHT